MASSSRLRAAGLGLLVCGWALGARAQAPASGLSVLWLSPTRPEAVSEVYGRCQAAAAEALTSVVGATVASSQASGSAATVMDNLHALPAAAAALSAADPALARVHWLLLARAGAVQASRLACEAALVDVRAPALLGYRRLDAPADQPADDLATALAEFVTQSLPAGATRESVGAAGGSAVGAVPVDPGAANPTASGDVQLAAAASAAAPAASAALLLNTAPEPSVEAPSGGPAKAVGRLAASPGLQRKQAPCAGLTPTAALLRGFAGSGLSLAGMGEPVGRPRVFEAAWQTLLLPPAGPDGHLDPLAHPAKVIVSVYSTGGDYQIEARFSRPVQLKSQGYQSGWTSWDVLGYQIEQEESAELGSTGFVVVHARPGDTEGSTRFGVHVRGGGKSALEVRDGGRLLSLTVPKVAAADLPDGPVPSEPETAGGHVIASQFGRASWYGADWQGRLTANGERFNMYALTAAHRSLPLGTLVRVTNLNNGRQVVLRINDRGPYAGGRILDVSAAAAEALDFISQGVAPVQIEVLGR
jgi:hypothetical protein